MRRRNQSIKARVPAMDLEIVPRRGRQGGIKKLLRAHGFRKSGKKWKLHTPPMDVSMRAGRANPSQRVTIKLGDLKDGDVIEYNGERLTVIRVHRRGSVTLRRNDGSQLGVQGPGSMKLTLVDALPYRRGRLGLDNPSRGSRANPSSSIVRRAARRPSRARYPHASKSLMAKRERCVRSIKRRRGKKPYNAWAVCTKSVERGRHFDFSKRRNPARGLRYEVWVRKNGKIVPVHASDSKSDANDRADFFMRRGTEAIVMDASSGRVVGPYVAGVGRPAARFNPAFRRPSDFEITRQGPAGHRSFSWTKRGVHYAVTFDPKYREVTLYEYTGSGEKARDRFGTRYSYDPWGPIPKKLVNRIGASVARLIWSAGAGKY